MRPSAPSAALHAGRSCGPVPFKLYNQTRAFRTETAGGGGRVPPQHTSNLTVEEFPDLNLRLSCRRVIDNSPAPPLPSIPSSRAAGTPQTPCRRPGSGGPEAAVRGTLKASSGAAACCAGALPIVVEGARHSSQPAATRSLRIAIGGPLLGGQGENSTLERRRANFQQNLCRNNAGQQGFTTA